MTSLQAKYIQATLSHLQIRQSQSPNWPLGPRTIRKQVRRVPVALHLALTCVLRKYRDQDCAAAPLIRFSKQQKKKQKKKNSFLFVCVRLSLRLMTDFDSASTSWSSSCASLGSPTSPAPDAPSRTSSVRSADSSSTGSNGPAAIIAPLAPLASAADDAEPRANWPLSAIAQPQFFQQQQQRPASPPHAVGPPRSPRVRSPTDGVTLFVSNIPLHVTDRSFAALFQQVPGFRSSRVRTDRTRRVIGFVEYVRCHQHTSATRRGHFLSLFARLECHAVEAFFSFVFFSAVVR